MFDVLPILVAGALLFGLVGLPILLIRELGRTELPSALRAPGPLPWPRGVQEEEPVRFRLDGPMPRPIAVTDAGAEEEPSLPLAA